MTEEGVQMNEETQPVQESTPTTQEENVDKNDLLAATIQESKKYRKRAQDAEAKLQEVTKIQEAQEVKQMKEQEKYKELYESAAPFKDKWESYESTRREALLSKLPEEDRESLSSKDIDTLEYIVKVKEESKPVNPQHQANASRQVVIEKPFAMMDEAERQAWHEAQTAHLRK